MVSIIEYIGSLLGISGSHSVAQVEGQTEASRQEGSIWQAIHTSNYEQVLLHIYVLYSIVSHVYS